MKETYLSLHPVIFSTVGPYVQLSPAFGLKSFGVTENFANQLGLTAAQRQG